jgi:streptogramin lyase
VPVGSDPRPGSVIAGYRLEDLLGRGGMGAVYRAEDVRLGRKVAVKLLAPELAENERFRERFLRESQLAAALDHPHIVPIYAAGEAERQLFLAMRYVEGYDLRQLLAREGPLPPARALRLVEQVGDALDAAHERGLIHRDVKPRNVLIAGGSGREHCYLADFGLTKQTSSISGLTGTGELVGTVNYVSPEQIRGEQVDGRADVYALGCVLYECLVGEPPFGRETEVATLWAHVNDPPPALAAARPELGGEIDRVLARALAKAPKDRYGSCRELIAAAGSALDLSAVSEPELPLRKPARRVRLARGRLLALLASATAVLAAAAVIAVLLLRGADEFSGIGPTSIGVIDPKTNRVLDAIPLGFTSPLIAAGEGHVWVVDPQGSTLTKIDPKAREIVRTFAIESGATPTGIAVGAGSVWVGVIRDRTLELLELGPELGERRDTIVLERGDAPFSVARESVLPAVDKGTVVTLEPGRGEVSRIVDGKASPLIEGLDAASIATAGDAIWLGGKTVVNKIDAETGSTLASVPVGGLLDSTSTSIQASEEAVWFAGTAQSRLFRIDPSGALVTTFPVCVGPSAIAVGEAAVWVACADGTVSRVNADETVDVIPMATPPAGIVADFGQVWTSPGGPLE